MEDKATLMETLVESAQEYTKSSIDLLKLKAIDKSAKMASSAVSAIIIGIVFLFVITMANIGAAIWIGEIIDNSYYGFFIIAAFYLFLALIFCIFRKSILKRPFSNRIIKKIRNEINI